MNSIKRKAGDKMAENRAMFGPGGNSESFYQQGNKSTLQAPEWVKKVGLDAYEYEAGRGVNASDETFVSLGEKAKLAGISLSIHAPYFISLSSVEPEKRTGSAKYILDSARALSLMGGKTMVIHAGSCAKLDRTDALNFAKDAIHHALNVLSENGLYGFILGIETMGKVNQLGTLDEVLEMCSVDKTVCPVIDFGHMNAREQGGVFESVDDYKRIFDIVEKRKSPEAAYNMHCHFSKIEHTKGGEKRHLTFEDTVYGPDYVPLMQAIAQIGAAPTIICESDGTQAEDALEMKNTYAKYAGDISGI